MITTTLATPTTTNIDTCGNCTAPLTQDDWCGYGGHDLNELFKEGLPEELRFRCCECLSNLTDESCDEDNLTSDSDTIPENLNRLAELVSTLARQNHPLAIEFHATYIGLREGIEGLTNCARCINISDDEVVRSYE
jgi:hypothetical protein